jgi:hypothetical protein
MDSKTRRRLRQFLRDERRRATSALVTGKADVQGHMERIEAAEKLLNERSSWRPDSLIAIVVAVLTALLVGLLLMLRIHDTPVHFTGRAEAIVLHFPNGVRWSAAPHELLQLRSIHGANRLWLPRSPRIDDPACGLSLENPGASDLRLVELAASGESWLTFWPTGDGGLEIETQGAQFDYRFSGEGEATRAEWRSIEGLATVNLAGEFVRAGTGCGGSTLRLQGAALAFDGLSAGRITFLRRGAEDLQAGGFVSSLLEGAVIFSDVGDDARRLRIGELVWLEEPSGQMTVRTGRESLHLTFDGRVDEIVLGRERRSANPSRLAYLRQNEQMLLIGWGLVAIWGFLWSARQLLFR